MQWHVVKRSESENNAAVTCRQSQISCGAKRIAPHGVVLPIMLGQNKKMFSCDCLSATACVACAAPLPFILGAPLLFDLGPLDPSEELLASRSREDRLRLEREGIVASGGGLYRRISGLEDSCVVNTWVWCRPGCSIAKFLFRGCNSSIDARQAGHRGSSSTRTKKISVGSAVESKEDRGRC